MINDIFRKISLEDTITTHFKWKEALYLHEWNMYAYPNDQQKYFIFSLALKLESIKQLFNEKSFYVTSWLRPNVYDNAIKNKLLNNESESRHCLGKAADFVVYGYDPRDVQKLLLNHQDQLQIRIELDTALWTHIDLDYKAGQNNTFTK